MIYLVITFFLIIFIVSYFLSNRKFYAPAVIVSGLWTICLLIFTLMGHDLYPISGKFLIAICIWVFIFTFFSLFAQSIRFNAPFKDVVPSQTARDIYFYFTIATLPFLILYINKIISSGFIHNPFWALRVANIKGETSSFFIVFWLISYVLELLCYSEKNKWRVILLFCVYLFYATISLGKSNFLTLFTVTFIVLLYKKQVKLKAFILSSSILLLIFIVIQALRSISGTPFDSKDFISMYLLSGMPAFEKVQPFSSIHFGENVFRLIYAIGYKFDFSNIQPQNPVLEFTNVPLLTNTYTVMYPFYKDFGISGIVLFGAFIGFVYGWIFNKMQSNDYYFLVLFAVFCTGLLVQPMVDTSFMLMSQNIQYVIVGIIPFLISKYHLFEKKTYNE